MGVPKETWGGPSEVTLGSQGSDFGGSQALRVKGSRGSGLGSQRGPSGSQGVWVGSRGVSQTEGVSQGGGQGPHLLLVQHLLLELLHDLALLVDLVILGGTGGSTRVTRGAAGWGEGAGGPGGSWELPGRPRSPGMLRVPGAAGQAGRSPSVLGGLRGSLAGPEGSRGSPPGRGSPPCRPAACRACGSPPRTCGAPRPRCG